MSHEDCDHVLRAVQAELAAALARAKKAEADLAACARPETQYAAQLVDARYPVPEWEATKAATWKNEQLVSRRIAVLSDWALTEPPPRLTPGCNTPYMDAPADTETVEEAAAG